MDLDQRSVLIVDDEPFIRQSFVDFFEDRRWMAYGAASGEEALEIVRRQSPLCAVVDIRLGGMDGETFIRKAFKEDPKLVFVICTGSPEYGAPNDLLKLTAVSSQIFWKPVTNIATLEADLIRMIAQRRAESDMRDESST